jgi:SAM-dependent methyltransferase
LELSIDEYLSLDPLNARQTTHLQHSVPPDRVEEATLDAAGLSATESVLDVGPGNGSFLRRLLRTEHRGPIYALDRSLTAAHQVARLNAGSVCGDACNLPFGESGFDVVFARHMLYHVSDVTRALSEFRRVLRPGGRCVSVVNNAEQAPRLAELLRQEVERTGVVPPSLPRVDASNLPELQERAFGDVAMVRFDGHLVFDDPRPLLRFAIALLGFYGVNSSSQHRAEIVHRLSVEIHRWFSRSAEPWRDQKGYVICVSRRNH